MLALILQVLNRFVVYAVIWLWWLPKGKDILFVSSDSSIWKEYMETQILPMVAGRAVVLNWSQRKLWSRFSFPVHLFRTFRGWRDFNPMVVVFRPLRPARVFRFLPAFKDWKHGRIQTIEELRHGLKLSL
jgi:hypothetical protein